MVGTYLLKFRYVIITGRRKYFKNSFEITFNTQGLGTLFDG